jgi:O-antigen ligase
MFYANSLAGAILLLMPVALGFTWLNAQRLSSVARWSAVAIVAVASLSILYWTGSKSAWLLTVVIGLTALWHTQIKTRWKAWLTGGFVILSLTGFALKHAGFFEKGATSVVARFDYWKAAVRIAGQHPIVGSGPGTFSIGYRRIKSPEAEFAMLCHNDYLEQACDSGLPGATAYTAFWILTLVALYKASRKNSDLMAFAAWLGLLGFFMHSFVEFHLYIPALSWTAFFLLGWAWSAAGPGRQASQRDPI